MTTESTGGGNPPDWRLGEGPHGSGAYAYDGVGECHRTVQDVTGNLMDVAGNDAATSLWFKTNGTVPVSTEQMLVYYEGNGTYPNTDYYKISLVEQGKVLYEFDTNQGSGTTTCKSTSTYDDDSWYNVIGVRDQNDDSCDLYIYSLSGTLLESPTGTISGSAGTGTIAVDAGDKMFVGSRSETDDWFKGWIDDIFHWNTVELDSTDADTIARVNHGTAAHKFDVSIDVHDIDGNWKRNEYASTGHVLPYHDPKHYDPATDDLALGNYNITMSVPAPITVSSVERLNFTMAFQEASGTWEPLVMGLKIDDDTVSPHTSYLQIPEPDNPFASYLRYDISTEMQLFVENTGDDGVYYVYSGTRLALDNGTDSFGSLIHYINGTTNPLDLWEVDMTHDSLYIAPGEIAHMYFYDRPTNHPCQNPGNQCLQGSHPNTKIVPDGDYRMSAWVNGYTSQGESFGRSVKLGSVTTYCSTQPCT